MALNADAKAALAEAVKVVRQDRIYRAVHDWETTPPDPEPPDPNNPGPPPPKPTDPPKPPEPPAKPSRWGLYADDTEPPK